MPELRQSLRKRRCHASSHVVAFRWTSARHALPRFTNTFRNVQIRPIFMPVFLYRHESIMAQKKHPDEWQRRELSPPVSQTFEIRRIFHHVFCACSSLRHSNTFWGPVSTQLRDHPNEFGIDMHFLLVH